MKISNSEFISISNNLGMEVTLCNFGASIYSITIDGKFMTHSPLDKKLFLKSERYYGKTIGPICGRIANNEIVDGENKKKVNFGDKYFALHSGKECYGFYPFNYQIVENGSDFSVIFSQTFEDKMNEGYFKAFVQVTYRIHKNENVIDYITEFTPVNDCYSSMTCHIYFNLNQDISINEHTLWIDSDLVSNLNQYLLLIDFKKPDQIFNFKKSHKIGDFIKLTYPENARGYDHAFILKEGVGQKVSLKGIDNKLLITTDLDSVVIYTNNYFDENDIMTNGKNDYQNASIAIEPQKEAFNFHKMFVKANTCDKHFITYTFIKEEK